MSDGRPTFVELADDSTNTGKRVRNVLVTVLGEDGVLRDMVQQVVSITDHRGKKIEFDDIEFKAAVLARLEQIAELLEQIVAD